MVTLEPQFIETKFPGYFFNSEDGKLYSLKVDGILKPLRFYTPNRFNHMWRYGSEGGYYVSVNGHRRFYPIEKLNELTQHNATIPVER